MVDGCEIGAVSGDGGPGEDEGLGDGVGVFDDYVEVLWCFGAGELSQIYISGGCGDEGGLLCVHWKILSSLSDSLYVAVN